MELWLLKSKQALICEGIEATPRYYSVHMYVRTLLHSMHAYMKFRNGASLRVKRTVAPWVLICR